MTDYHIFSLWKVPLFYILYNKTMEIHHNLFITLLLGSNVETVLVKQMLFYPNKND